MPDDDQLGGLRPLLVDDGVLGYEPHGFPDHCWILHAAYEGPDRVRWSEALARSGRQLGAWRGTLSHRVLDGSTMAPDAEKPLIGVPDRESLARLVEVLARHSPGGPDTECCWAQAWIEDITLPTVLARRGRLQEGPAHYDACQDRRSGVTTQFPAQWWPTDRSWYVLTNWDLSATEVFGSAELVADLMADDWLEAVRHPTIAEVESADT